LAYRLYSNPFVMFGLVALYFVFFTNRININGAEPREKRNTYITNLDILFVFVLLIAIQDVGVFIVVHGISVYLSAALAIWLFYIQHTFEDSYFEEESEWNYLKAAVDGSSYYQLPKLLQWLSGNIGYHHVHHL